MSATKSFGVRISSSNSNSGEDVHTAHPSLLARCLSGVVEEEEEEEEEDAEGEAEEGMSVVLGEDEGEGEAGVEVGEINFLMSICKNHN